MTDPSIFTVGGTVQAGGGIYLPRPADDELLQHCLSGDFCYVLTARQMGKSSLMVRTAETLRSRNVRTVLMDLTRLGTNLQSEQWYLGLVDELVEQLDLQVDYKTWWQAHAHLGAIQRLSRFLREIVLETLDAPLVIFIDEIDTTLSLDFADDFFAAIRACYNARGTDAAYKRLSFVLLGVATPGDLIRNPQRTPFNIGQRIDLTDFTLEQALPLADGLNLPAEQARQTLGWVLDWTGGHPYLTQRLCRALLERSPHPGPLPAGEGEEVIWNEAAVAQVVEETFFGERSKQDGNLQFVRDMLTRRAPDVRKVLQTYQKVRTGKPVRNEEQSLVVAHLKVSGVVHAQDGLLAVRNRIYERTFDPLWVRQSMPSPVPQRIMWGASILVMLALVVIGYFGYQEWNRTDSERAARYQSRFETATTPAEKLDNLASLFTLAQGDFAPSARSNFFALSQDEKLALFKDVRDSKKQAIVARNIYQQVFINSGEEPQNEESLMRAIALAVRDADPALADEIDYWLKGRMALANKDIYDALNALKSAQAINPDNPAILVDLARAYVAQGDDEGYEDALQVLAQTVETDPRRITIVPIRRLLVSNSPFTAYWQAHKDLYAELGKIAEVPMASIPAGTFQMGGDPQAALAECKKYYDSCGDVSTWEDEAPIHTVTLDAFEMDIYEVTNAEYALCVAAGVCSPPEISGSWTRDSYYGDPAFDNFPVIYVTWFQADTYCSWRGARLPTEAEWEYAARGGLEGKLYPWGDESPNCSQANSWQKDSACIGDTTPVGNYAPNGYGLYDMAGNVWEWVGDWYSADYYATVKGGISNPPGPTEGDARALRGGSWYVIPDFLRVSGRNRDVPDGWVINYGFRCAR